MPAYKLTVKRVDFYFWLIFVFWKIWGKVNFFGKIFPCKEAKVVAASYRSIASRFIFPWNLRWFIAAKRWRVCSWLICPEQETLEEINSDRSKTSGEELNDRRKKFMNEIKNRRKNKNKWSETWGSAKVHIELRDRESSCCHKSIARQVIEDNDFHLTFTTSSSALLRSKNSRVMIVKSALWNWYRFNVVSLFVIHKNLQKPDKNLCFEWSSPEDKPERQLSIRRMKKCEKFPKERKSEVLRELLPEISRDKKQKGGMCVKNSQDS